jgi:prepilin-type N-terminal cleavage/methylation domain-containing protein
MRNRWVGMADSGQSRGTGPGTEPGSGHSRDGGYTMMEMVVVVMILGIVLAMVQTTLILTQRTVAGSGSRVDQTMQARVAIDSLTKVLRTAVLPSQLNGTGSSSTAAAFIQGTKTSVQFYANINNDSNIIGPSQVTYNIDSSGMLTEKIQPPDAHAVGNYNYLYTCTTCATTRVLARNVSTTQAMFTYYTKTGATITDTVLTAADLSAVDSVDVVIMVKASANQTIQATTLYERVTLPNADSVALATSSP